MSKKGMVIILASLLHLNAVAGNKVNVILPGGNMKFEGKVISEACNISIMDSRMTVDMGKISTNAFKGYGSYANPVYFRIKLSECRKDVYEKVSVLFTGLEDKRIPGTLSLLNENSSAEGLGISFFDVKKKPVNINVPSPIFYSIDEGSTILEYTARYIALKEYVSGGRVNAWVNFSVVYQ